MCKRKVVTKSPQIPALNTYCKVMFQSTHRNRSVKEMTDKVLLPEYISYIYTTSRRALRGLFIPRLGLEVLKCADIYNGHYMSSWRGSYVNDNFTFALLIYKYEQLWPSSNLSQDTDYPEVLCCFHQYLQENDRILS
jgi:hypothetical protein